MSSGTQERTSRGTLNELLQSELDIIEKYHSALDALNEDPRFPDVQRLEHQHREAAMWLQQTVDDSPPGSPRQISRPPTDPGENRFPWDILAAGLLLAGAALLLLVGTTGGIPLWFIAAMIGLFCLGGLHYAFWGKAMQDRFRRRIEDQRETTSIGRG